MSLQTVSSVFFHDPILTECGLHFKSDDHYEVAVVMLSSGAIRRRTALVAAVLQLSSRPT